MTKLINLAGAEHTPPSRGVLHVSYMVCYDFIVFKLYISPVGLLNEYYHCCLTDCNCLSPQYKYTTI
jgi:hypothetical protein